MKNYKEIYPNRIPEYINLVWVRKALKKTIGESSASNTNIFRWSKGLNYPPVDVLVSIANITSKNTSYLIGQTDIPAENELKQIKHVNTDKLIRAQSLTQAELSRKVGTSPRTICTLLQDIPDIRTNSLIAIADAFNVSTDYLLGLTTHERWEDYYQATVNPFAWVKDGQAAYIDEESDGEYCLLSYDGKTVYMADGESYLKTDEKFSGKLILPLTYNAEEKCDE